MSTDSDFSAADLETAAAAQPSTDSSETTSAAPPPEDAGAATTQPAEAQGPLPFQRHKEILESTRKKYEDELGWARNYEREQVTNAQNLWNWADRDPIGFYRWFESQIKMNPDYRDHLTPAQEQAQQAPPETPQLPQADLVTNDGERVFSAGQAESLVRYYVEQLRQEFLGKVEPVAQQFQQQQREMQATTEARKELAEAETWPYFDDFAEDIYHAMNKDRRLSLDGAYRRVVLPRIRQIERQSVLSELNKKTGASTEAPGRPGQLTPRKYRDMSWEEALAAKAQELGGS